MSQTGTILSVSPYGLPGSNDWILQYSYTLDAGGSAQAQVIVGNVDDPGGYSYLIPGHYQLSRVAFWASPTSTVSVPSAPGASGANVPILIPCPPLVQWAAFGIPQKGFPVA